MQSLIGNIFRFREHQIALSADIEAMSPQVAVRSDDSRCLRFLRRDDPEQRKEVFEYARHVFVAKNSPTCANYALHQVAKDNGKEDANLVIGVQRNFYMKAFLNSIRTPQEAIKIYKKVKEILSKGGFILTKWITIDEEVKSAIPEVNRSTEIVIVFEVESESSSIHGLNWNVDTESFIVCGRAIEQENQAKKKENCPILCLSSVRSTWEMFTLHLNKAVSTQKHLGSNAKSMSMLLSQAMTADAYDFSE